LISKPKLGPAQIAASDIPRSSTLMDAMQDFRMALVSSNLRHRMTYGRGTAC
jgi:hypothetical protein